MQAGGEHPGACLHEFLVERSHLGGTALRVRRREVGLVGVVVPDGYQVLRHRGWSSLYRIGSGGSVSVSCEHGSNDPRGKKVQSDKSDFARGCVRERRRGGTGERGEPGSDPDEPLTSGGAAPDQHGHEHPAAHCREESELGEGRYRNLAVHSQRDSAAPQDSRASSGGRGGQRTGGGGGPRQRPGQPVPGDGGAGRGGNGGHDRLLSRRRHLRRSPCPRTATENSTPAFGRISWASATSTSATALKRSTSPPPPPRPAP